MPASTPERQLCAAAPVFLVADIDRAAAYYRDVLGCTIDRLWGDPPSFGMPHRDGVTFMLKEVADRTLVVSNSRDCDSWDAHVWVQDADALFAELEARGAIVHYAPINRPLYGNREFAIRDPDGHVIAFGHHVGD